MGNQRWTGEGKQRGQERMAGEDGWGGGKGRREGEKGW